MVSVLAGTLVSGLLVALGFLAFILPGFVLIVLYYVAVPAAVVEGGGILRALSRSTALTEGFRVHIFVLALLVGVLSLAIYFLVGVPPSQFPAAETLEGVLVQEALGAVFTALGAVTAAVVYYDLRLTKEGVDVEELVQVFE